jgi:hypothetical protein
MDEHYLFSVADEASVVDAVRARYAEGPYVPHTGDGPIARRVEIMGSIVRETGEVSGGDAYLGHYLADRFGEPVVLQSPGAEFAYLVEPGGELDGRVREALEIPAWKPTVTLELALDRDKQFDLDRNLSTVERQLPKLFPIENRRKTARLDLKKLDVYSYADHRYTPGKVRHENYVQLELQLALFEWTPDGNERSLVELRKENVVFCRIKLLTPSGMYVYQGEELPQPADEYWFEFFRGTRRWLRAIRDDMSERTSWKGVTPQTLLDR